MGLIPPPPQIYSSMLTGYI